jgi:RNA polymerase sigma factor (sigma-70 family)
MDRLLMSSTGSITHLLDALKNGNQAAAQPLWERYHSRLMGLARQVLHSSPRGHADEEDVVQNAFNSFFQGVANGRFPQLNDRDNLWRLLVVLAARRAIDQVRRERRQQPAGVTPGSDPSISLLVGLDDDAVLEQVVAREPTPELAAELVEQYENLLNRLGDATLRQLAIWKLEGFTNGEIAAKFGCSRRTVIRKLETIRLIWSTEPEP